MINSKIKNLKKRNAKEARFKFFGRLAIAFSLAFLVVLFSMIISKSNGAFTRSEIALNVDLTSESDLSKIDYRQKIKQSLKQKFPTNSLAQTNSLYQLLSKASNLDLENQLAENPESLGKNAIFWFSASSKVDMFIKHQNSSNLNERQLLWVQELVKDNQVRTSFNWEFFTFADSREPEIAGIGAGLKGSILVMAVFLICAFPIGVMCAFYLEEFAKKNRLTDIIEISINNLAAIPSIIYGLLGLVVYLQFMHFPRSSSIVGGLIYDSFASNYYFYQKYNSFNSKNNS